MEQRLVVVELEDQRLAVVELEDQRLNFQEDQGSRLPMDRWSVRLLFCNANMSV